jgi:hypothetical protein
VTGTAILNALFGAALVAIGILAAALADRIRGIRGVHLGRATAREADREFGAARARRSTAAPIHVVEPALASPKATKTAADDVIAALVAAGYKKSVATAAAWGCSTAERTTIEAWTRAALRHCARGGMA